MFPEIKNLDEMRMSTYNSNIQSAIMGVVALERNVINIIKTYIRSKHCALGVLCTRNRNVARASCM